MMHSITKNRAAGSRILALGILLAALLTASLLLAAMPSYASTTFTVNSSGDKNDLDFPGGVFDGSSAGKCFTGDVLVVQGKECTLRGAIQEANVTPGADTINFDIPGTGVATIAPASQLPTITGPLSINGYSQPGAQPNTKALGNDALLKVELSGAGISGIGSQGLRISAANTTLKGLAITHWGYGISISGSGATGNRVTGNYIGTDASGTLETGNSGTGVYISNAPNNTIGGPTAAERNVISGNYYGVEITNNGASGNRVMGNYIGTDKSGTLPLGNYVGVRVFGASNNTFGGTTAGARNVISGNDQVGVYIAGQDDTGNRVIGNYIGTDASGTERLGNFYGVAIAGANNTVGGTTAAERNVISGNVSGVYLYGTGGNKVRGNYLGTDASGAKALGNGYGVYIYGAPNNTIGGQMAGARNVISANEGSGVSITDVDATGNRVLRNSIFANGLLGIDLDDDNVPTANDPGDTDTGANNLQNKPDITSAKSGSLKSTIKGSLNSTPNKTFTVQYFSNRSGTDQGKKYIGQKSVTTDASGNVTFTFSTKKKVSKGRTITATATGAEGTSEFSAPKKVVAS